MRIVTFMLVLSVVPYFGISQNKITGKVVDQLGFPIYRASAEISTTDIITYTDYDGSFLLKSEKDFHWKVNIKSKGYEPESWFCFLGGETRGFVFFYFLEIKKNLFG
ncbi:MAG: hypothetical protein AAF348_10300, partial [Bacteroidota bacterium]